jgi:hypothetical protein
MYLDDEDSVTSVLEAKDPEFEVFLAPQNRFSTGSYSPTASLTVLVASARNPLRKHRAVDRVARFFNLDPVVPTIEGFLRRNPSVLLYVSRQTFPDRSFAARLGPFGLRLRDEAHRAAFAEVDTALRSIPWHKPDWHELSRTNVTDSKVVRPKVWRVKGMDVWRKPNEDMKAQYKKTRKQAYLEHVRKFKHQPSGLSSCVLADEE